jgi:hypothetical protein
MKFSLIFVTRSIEDNGRLLSVKRKKQCSIMSVLRIRIKKWEVSLNFMGIERGIYSNEEALDRLKP